MTPASGRAGEDDAPVRQVVGEVVVGYDGSPASVAALRWAAAEAGARGAVLRVLCVADLGRHTDPAALGPGTLTTVQRLFRDELAAAGTLADEGAAIASQVDGGPLDRRVTPRAVLGRATAVLLEASEEADLLVLGHRGRSELVTALLGSVAFSVTAAATCPVVVVRGDARPAAGAPRPVVLGVDVGDGCEQARSPALSIAATSAQRSAAPLTVLGAVGPDEALTGDHDHELAADVIAHQRSRAGRRIDAACAAALRERPGLDVRGEVVTARPADALTAASETADLVVVGTRGAGAVSGLFLGSISHAVVHRAACPVVVARTRPG